MHHQHMMRQQMIWAPCRALLYRCVGMHSVSRSIVWSEWRKKKSRQIKYTNYSYSRSIQQPPLVQYHGCEGDTGDGVGKTGVLDAHRAVFPSMWNCHTTRQTPLQPRCSFPYSIRPWVRLYLIHQGPARFLFSQNQNLTDVLSQGNRGNL